MAMRGRRIRRRRSGARTLRRKIYRRFRRYVRRRGISMRSNNFGGFPYSKVVKLRYSQGFELQPGVAGGNVGTYKFRANAPYDPDYTGGGHQPMGYDTWSAVYNYVTVVGAKMRVTFIPSSDQAVMGLVVGTLVDDDGTVTAPVDTMIERGTSNYRHLAYNGTQYTKAVSLTKGFSAKKFFHVKDIRDNIYNIGSTVGITPNDQAFFVVWGGYDDTGSGTPDPVRCQVTIEYICLFTQPKDQSQN